MLPLPCMYCRFVEIFLSDEYLLSKRPLQQMIRSWLAMIFTIKLSVFLFLSIAHSIDDYSQRLRPWATDYQVGLKTWMSFSLEFFQATPNRWWSGCTILYIIFSRKLLFPVPKFSNTRKTIWVVVIKFFHLRNQFFLSPRFMEDVVNSSTSSVS